MANWYGTSRTNYFKVKDAEAFKADMADYDVEVWGEGERFGLCARGEDGDWPNYDVDGDEPFDFWQRVASHLADGEVAVFQTTGAEKLRYLTGHAVAVTNAGAECWINIDDIYRKAAATFGVPLSQITKAQY